MQIRLATPSAFLALLLTTVAVYWPGLHGSFLFDDFANLPALGASGPIDTWPNFWRYITSGTADPTGRPLTLLTFLLDAQNWPADPHSFKRSNLVLHLLNGMLLALLLRWLGRQSFKQANPQRMDLAAVIGAGFWLLHPLFVSTTLYIVQREAMLPATFTLLGLSAWLHGRTLLFGGQPRRGLTWITLGLGGCTVLGVLSKANGILLPALALVVEYVLLRPRISLASSSTSANPSPLRTYRRSMLLLACLPAAAVSSYLLYCGWSGFVHGISSVRPWTLGQRLLTEPRVLMDYLDLLWLPRPFTPGLFNDHVKASTSLWSPVATLPALLTVLALITGAWLWRRRWPAAALVILFYFVGQSLESSTVALELYYEHRNYLPAMLMFWPLALWLCNVRSAQMTAPFKEKGEAHAPPQASPPPLANNKAKLALALLILAGLGLMTHARASLWGNTHDQALLWATLNPNSPRAQANAAQVEMSTGHPERAIARLHEPLARSPDQLQLALNLIDAECQHGQIQNTTLIATRRALQTTRDPGTLLVSWFERAMERVATQPTCSQLTYPVLSNLLQATLANPLVVSNAGRRQDLHYLQGRIALLQDNADTALLEFNQALDAQVQTPVALKQAALLGSSGFPQLGLRHLDHLAAEPGRTYVPRFGMPRIHAWVLQRQQYWPKEVARLRATLQEDTREQAQGSE